LLRTLPVKPPTWKKAAFWDLTWCNLEDIFTDVWEELSSVFYYEDGVNTLLRNVDKHRPE
jgi:hypothetical protein